MTKTDAAVQTLSGINPDVVLEVSNCAQYNYCYPFFYYDKPIVSSNAEHRYFFVEVTKSRLCSFCWMGGLRSVAKKQPE
jgi:hypothetical protein